MKNVYEAIKNNVSIDSHGGFQVALIVIKMQVQSLCQEDALEDKMAIHFSILNGRIRWMRSLVNYINYGVERVRHS